MAASILSKATKIMPTPGGSPDASPGTGRGATIARILPYFSSTSSATTEPNGFDRALQLFPTPQRGPAPGLKWSVPLQLLRRLEMLCFLVHMGI